MIQNLLFPKLKFSLKGKRFDVIDDGRRFLTPLRRKLPRIFAKTETPLKSEGDYLEGDSTEILFYHFKIANPVLKLSNYTSYCILCE